MSNFLKQGARANNAAEKKETKQRLKEIYKIMDTLDEIAPKIYKEEEWAEDNVITLAAKYTDINIGGLEKMLLLGKLENIREGLDGKANNK